MSQNEPKRTNGDSSTLPSSRRQFLQAAGFAGLAGLTTAASTERVAAAPSDTPGGPGAVQNLSEYIEAPGVFAENQESPRVHTSVPFSSVRDARDANKPFTELESRLGNSEYFQLLNGDWDFAWYEKPADVPDSYANTDWDSVTVPGCWQTQGYDTYVYLNTQLTWEGIDQATDTTPPQVPDDYNPVGTYRRSFTVPANWDGRESFLNFEGVKQACFVWVDDQYVGYNQGSMTSAEFDITEYVSAGSNHDLTVQVYRFSDGEALETSDMFRWSGIYRSVYLYSTPKVHLRDFFVRTDLDDNYENADLSVDAELANYTKTAQGNHTVRGHLFDSEGTKVTTLEMSETVDESAGTTLSGSTTVTNPEKWSAETPTLYTIVLEHQSGGATTETMFDSVGFREYSISDQQFRVNGEPVNIRGVNSMEHDPDHGRTVPLETEKKDFELMKQYNVNALRCSHYPRDPTVYYLADEYGLYLEDEVGVETHWNTNLLGQSDEWDAQAVERFRRMVQSDKNRPCIFMWGTGNEAGLHDAHFEMAEFETGEDEDGDGEVLENYSFDPIIDQTRFLYHQANNGGTAPYAQIDGPRYIDPAGLEGVATSNEDRPVVMGEYSHAMGNALWAFDDFWDIIQPKKPNNMWRQIQGGFVWDWVDQSVNRTEIKRVGFTTPDASGNDYTGVLRGNPDVVDTDTGKGISLDGNDDYVDVNGSKQTAALNFTQPGFSISARVKTESISGPVPLVSKGDRQYALKIQSPDRGSNLEFYIHHDGNWISAVAGLPDDWARNWHTITGVCDDSELRLYVDGTQLATKSHSVSSINDDGYPLQLGHNAQRGFFGEATIDEVQIYDRALSASEVGAEPSDAVLRYPFNSFDMGHEETIDYRFYDGDPFCINGMVWADREPQPELSQFKQSTEPFAVIAEDLVNGSVTVRNQHNFTNLNEFKTVWKLQTGNETLQQGTLDLNLAPNEEKTLTVPFEKPDLEAGTEYWLTLSLQLATDVWWADAGHEIGFEQFKVPFDVPTASLASVSDLPSVSMSESNGQIVLSSDNFEYTFDRGAGKFTMLSVNGKTVLSDSQLLRVFDWTDLTHQVKNVTTDRIGDSVFRIQVESFATQDTNTDAGFDVSYTYHILGSSDVLMSIDVDPHGVTTELDRIGLQFNLPKRFDSVSWYGRGPKETYPKRKTGMKIGTYSGSVEDQYVDYIPPQNNGNKTETRWAALTDDSGTGFAVFGHPEVNFSLSIYDNIHEAGHNYELVESDSVTLNVDSKLIDGDVVDGALRGIPKLTPQQTSFGIGFRPFQTDTTDPATLNKRRLPYEFTSGDTYDNLSTDYDKSTGDVTVSAVARNPTGTSKQTTVPLKVNGSNVKTQDITLAPGEETDITFEYHVGDSGIFEIAVGDLPPINLTLPKTSLAGEWLFHKGDEAAWKQADYDDSSWQVVNLPASWDNTSNYTEDQIYGWYRKTITIPKAWNGHDLKIPVGKVDDVDETFFNGTKIGQTGTFPPNYQTAFDQVRRYTVPAENVNFGGKNVIAVRVYDGSGGGGMTQGPLGPIKGTSSLSPVGDNVTPPTDPNGDGHYEDVNGDEEVTDADGNALFKHFEDPEVQNHPEAYDFNENGRLDLDDIVEWRKEKDS